ncbi:MAG: class E sortase [Actinomycetota bacterium]|nr:class E sortase [Actinomycetota bacterium]HZY65141.1 class E sortase [Rubrobacteraceae bacterium]
MRRLFGNWGNVGFYALGVAALLAIGATVFFGTSLLRSDGSPVERAVTPTVSEQEVPEKVEEKEEPQDQYGEPVVEEAPAEETPDLAAAPSDDTLYLTVPKMGRYNDLVINDMSEATLDQGAGKLPSSGFPWEPGANTYIAAHVLGWEGTNSWLQFANLPNMTYGDVIYLTDSAGTTYTYEVTEVLTVSPYDVWVADPQPGRDMVSLQTCVGANYEWRLIVRGDRVA